jgi:hypothetical protein
MMERIKGESIKNNNNIICTMFFALQWIYGQDPPVEFESSQSTLQAFYFFSDVILDGEPIVSDDWVAAFNGDICVGARQWNTNDCGGGLCDVPAMGYDGSEYTVGYMQIGDIPTFKIYDTSSSTIYDAMPSVTVDTWSISAFSMNGLLYSSSINSADYQYNGSVTSKVHIDGEEAGSVDDLIGAFVDGEWRGIINGSVLPSGLGGGYSFNIMIYSNETIGEVVSFKYFNPENDVVIELDETLDFIPDMIIGNVNEPFIFIITSGCTDSDACNYTENAAIDDGSCDYSIDDCGVCGGENTSQDCAGECDGDALEDNCGICDNDYTNDCVQDCSGEWGGLAAYDDCTISICSSGSTGLVANASCTDCNGDINGSAFIDGCGECVSGNTAEEPCPHDCAGVDGGDAVLNACNTCICNGSVALEGFECSESEVCIAGCDGFWYNNGLAPILDNCQVCDGDGSSCLSIDNHIVESFSINRVYPNPFNPVVNIDLSIDIAGNLRLSVFTIEGIQIKTIYNGPSIPGESTFKWKPEDRASGFYFVSAVIDDQVKTQKVLFLK